MSDRRPARALFDPEAVRAALGLLLAPGQVTELRVLEATTRDDRWQQTLSGYFDNFEQLIAALGTINSAKGIYIVPNPVLLALLSRACNRIRRAPKGESTQDVDIVKRLWLLIDADAQRPSGISATNLEHQAALERAQAVSDHLTGHGWPAPIYADSGNGGHLLYRVDLPTEDGGLVQRCLEVLAQRFDDDVVKIDRKVFNPARIWKLYGTLACKGDNGPERPHRMSRILNSPENLAPVSHALLEELAADVRPQANARSSASSNGGFDLDKFIEQNGWQADGPHPWTGQQGHGRRWIFSQSPMCEHHDGAAFILEHAGGAITAGCHHNSCNWSWKDLRRKREVQSNPNGEQTNGEPWPDPSPLPEELPPVQAFDDKVLPASFRPWIADIAERMQCPPEFPAVAAMIVLAGIVGRQVGIRPKREDDWLVVPNLWGAIIGRPGLLKTPAIQESINFLKRFEIRAKEEYEIANKEYETTQMIAKAAREVRQGQMKDAIRKGQDPKEIAAQDVEGGSLPPVRKRYLLNDTTVEKLGEILNENPRGVTVFRDELIGLLKSLDQEGREGSRAFYLEAWNGTGRFTYDRIGRGTIDIDAAIVSIIGGIQPGPLSQYLKATTRGGEGDDGLIQRFQLAVWPDVSGTWKNVDRRPDTRAKQDVFDVCERLQSLQPQSIGAETDPYDPHGIPFVRFSPEAQGLFDAWRTRLEGRLRADEEHPAVESHLAKYRSLIPSLALLIHLADSGSGPVAIAPLKRALGWATYLESHARRIYSVAINPQISSTRALAKKLIKGDVSDGFALREVYRKNWTGLSAREDVEAAAECLVDLGWLRVTEERTAGRTAVRYSTNPKITEMAGSAGDKSDKSPPPPPSGTFVTGDSGDSAEIQPVQPTGDSVPNEDEESDWGTIT